MLPGDYGVQIPNPGASHIVPKWSTEAAAASAASGRPYMWVQRMCGLDFINNQVVSEADVSGTSGEHICGCSSPASLVIESLLLNDNTPFKNILSVYERHI